MTHTVRVGQKWSGGYGFEVVVVAIEGGQAQIENPANGKRGWLDVDDLTPENDWELLEGTGP